MSHLPVKPTLEDVAGGLRDWLKEEIRSTSSSTRDLGKFFFGVSASSIGLLVGVAGLRRPLATMPVLHATIASLAVMSFLISGLLALRMVVPSVLKLRVSTDLAQEHSNRVYAEERGTKYWLVAWFIGLVLSLVLVFWM